MKIICVESNYSQPVGEKLEAKLSEPILYLKPDTALLRNNDPFYIPDWASCFDYGVELVARISRLGRCIDPHFANRYYDAVALGVGFTARDRQGEVSKRGLPWEVCRSFDYSAAISPFISKEQYGDIRNIHFTLDVNGKRRQEGCPSQMVFDIDMIIAHVSRFFSLRMGDMIYTGCPSSAIVANAGDRLTASIEGRTMLDFRIR